MKIAAYIVNAKLTGRQAAAIGFILGLVPQLVLAQSPCPTNGSQLCDPLGNQTIIDFFNSIVDVLMVFAVPFIVFFLMYAGYLYVTAQGNSSKIKDAHNALLYALIGGVIILGAHALLIIVQGTVSQFTTN